MRILFWSETFWPLIGGIETMAGRFVAKLHEHGHQLLVVTRKDTDRLPDYDRFQSIPVHRFRFRHALSAGGIATGISLRRRITDLKQGFAPDLIHIYSISPSLLFHRQTVKAPPAPLVLTLHRPIENIDPAGLVAATLRSARAVVGCSREALRGLPSSVPEFKGRAEVIYNAVPPPPDQPAPLPWDPPTLLCVGRLSFEKGFDIALSAFAEIVKRMAGVRLQIVGEGPERADLERRIAALNLEGRVAMPGWVAPTEVPAVMNAATVVLVPSRRESFGLVALEAALMARPVAAADTGGLPEVVLQGATGFLSEAGNPAALAEAVLRLLQDKALAERMGGAARARALEVFSLDAHVGRYEEIYAQIAQKETR